MIKTFIEKEKVEDKSGPKAMKYDKDFLKECMLLKKKSVSAYHHIKTRKLLPLPAIATVQKLINNEEKASTTSKTAGNVEQQNTAAIIDNDVDEPVTQIVIEISPEAEALLNAATTTSTDVDTSTVIATG